MQKKTEKLKVRNGANHSYLFNYDGLIPCPVAKSTNTRKMLVPWMKQATGYSAGEIYQSLKQGEWRI